MMMVFYLDVQDPGQKTKMLDVHFALPSDAESLNERDDLNHDTSQCRPL